MKTDWSELWDDVLDDLIGRRFTWEKENKVQAS